ncbi:MAG: alpha/beta hydrolase [Planctomycetes bacterium]|nr:alpha/beta hydrolase [Planctomycetota bacterium]
MSSHDLDENAFVNQPSLISSTDPHHHSKTRPRLVYLPGIDGTGRLLHRQFRLHEEYDVRCVSYPQDRPNTYEELAKLGEAQLEPNGGIVLAESFGGAVALTLALRRPDLVKRLVLVNTFAWFPRRPLINLISILGPFLPRRPAVSWTRGIRGLFFFPPGIPQAFQDEWWDLTSDVPMWAYGMRFGLIADIDLRRELPSIRIPTIVFVSPNDRVVPPPAGRLLAKLLPDARLIERRAGHAAMIHPEVDIAEMLASSPESAFAPDAR